MLAGLTRITAPFEGIVTRRNYHPGDFVRSPKDGGALPLVAIDQAVKVRVIVQVPDLDAPLLDAGDPVLIFFDALPDRQYRGRISRTAYAENPNNHMLQAEVDLDNADGRLRPGQNGLVDIQLENPHPVLRIPQIAIITVGGGTEARAGCFRVVDGRAVETPIKIGYQGFPDGQFEVLEGLAEGDTVVVDPRTHKIQAGQVIPAGQGVRVP